MTDRCVDYGNLVSQFDEYRVIIEPDEDTPDWWAGAPSVVRTEDGEFIMAVRMREGNSSRGKRGYEIRILKSPDGRHFSPIFSIHRDQAGRVGFERPALVTDPETGRFRLYVSTPVEGPWWGIFKFDDVSDLCDLDLNSLHPVLPPVLSTEGRHDLRRGYKDPFIFFAGGMWHMYVIGHDLVERVWHFTSGDGETWQADSHNPVLDNSGWHNFYTRPACVMPAGFGHLFVYEGSSSNWYDPSYNIATGLAYTLDFSGIVDLTPEAPLLKSTTSGDYHTWRYSHWLWVGNEIFVYAEVARPNSTNEVRLFVLQDDWLSRLRKKKKLAVKVN